MPGVHDYLRVHGPGLLAAARLTDGRPAATHYGVLENLRGSGIDVVEARVVDNGYLVTAGRVTASIDLVVHLVGQEFGADAAERVATDRDYEMRGKLYRGRAIPG